MKCSVEGCGNDAGVPGSARGWCRAHYRRWQRYGNVEEPSRRIATWGDETCAESDCSNRVYAHGVCEKHGAALSRRNNPELQKLRTQAYVARQKLKQEQLMGRPRPLLCELCANPPAGRGNKPGSGICFDHDHATGKPRGWLCDRCNKVLGLVYDSPELLRSLALYLEKHTNDRAHLKAA